MKTPLIAGLCALMVVSACARLGESRLNPFNWFKRSESQAVDAATQAYAARKDPRPLVSQVVSMTVEQTPGGAIITATGLPPTQGHFEASLVDETDDQAAAAGAMILAFRAVPPEGVTASGPPRSRQITVAEFVTDQRLARVTRIIVLGQQNQRVARR